MELIQQGAEARLYKVDMLGSVAVLKERFQKEYRHPELEKKLTKTRFVQEVRCTVRAMKAGVATPALLFADMQNYKLILEYIDGKPLREVFDEMNEEVNTKICQEFGAMIARLHDANIAHGDLTTSNILLRHTGGLVLIDFGLAKSNANIEDKAVDMYVLERAFSSTHPGSEAYFEKLFESYSDNLGDKDKPRVIAKFKQCFLPSYP